MSMTIAQTSAPVKTPESPSNGGRVITEPTIIVAQHEPTDAWEPHFTVPTIRGKVRHGDYTLASLEYSVGIERLTTYDLSNVTTFKHREFEAQLSRARGLDMFAIICEGKITDIHHRRYNKPIEPQELIRRVGRLWARYRVPFLWAHSPKHAANLAEILLVEYWNERISPFVQIAEGVR